MESATLVLDCHKSARDRTAPPEDDDMTAGAFWSVPENIKVGKVSSLIAANHEVGGVVGRTVQTLVTLSQSWAICGQCVWKRLITCAWWCIGQENSGTPSIDPVEPSKERLVRTFTWCCVNPWAHSRFKHPLWTPCRWPSMISNIYVVTATHYLSYYFPDWPYLASLLSLPSSRTVPVRSQTVIAICL